MVLKTNFLPFWEWPFYTDFIVFIYAEWHDLSLIWIKLQGSHRLENYLNLEGFLEKSLKIKSALKSTGK